AHHAYTTPLMLRVYHATRRRTHRDLGTYKADKGAFINYVAEGIQNSFTQFPKLEVLDFSNYASLTISKHFHWLAQGILKCESLLQGRQLSLIVRNWKSTESLGDTNQPA